MKRIMIIYSHRDEEWKDLLQSHLEVLKVDAALAWNDKKIEVGSNWFQEIRRNLKEAQVIILLISADFLVSDFIHKVEIPLLLEEHEKKDDLMVIPMVVRPCPWQLLPWLRGFQVLPKNGIPLINYNPGEREAILSDLDRSLYRLLFTKEQALVPPSQSALDFPGDESHRSLYQRLLDGSKRYYEVLTGENGRFRMLQIEDLILSRSGTKEQWVTQSISGENEVYNKYETVITLLPRSWKQSRKHAVIVGDGGMGKTVSLVRLWETLLDRIANDNDEPVPVFIALNEFNQVKEEKRQGFVLNHIRENYCDSSTSIEEIWDAMKQPLPEDAFKPRIALLLDGFNEITVEKKELLLEIKRIMEQCPGTRIVLTSRYDMRGQYQWGNWNLVHLLKLGKKQVKSYLQEKKLGIPGQARFLGLIGNPMMLTLYSATSEVKNKNRESEHCHFKDRVESVGELLWNFMEAQVGNLRERLGEDQEKVYYYKFLLKFFLPALGFEMEKAGLFDFTNAQINSHIDRIFERFSQADFFDTYAEFEGQARNLPLGACATDLERRERAVKLKRIFCEEMHILVKEGESFRFLHLDFRDFFAAVHVLNEVEISVRKGEIPVILKEGILDYFVRRLIGEIEGEHRSKPYLMKEEGWKINIKKENRLNQVLDLCRGKFGEEVRFAVWNVVTIWKEVRGELSGADLSNLDLSGVPLNGVRCSRFYENRYLAAVFDGSRVHEKNLLSRGHSHWINSAVYSPDGEKILSASEDNTIKEWDTGTGECLKTLAGHTMEVTSADYSPDGKKILSASEDKTIKEWDAGTGELVKTLAGHTGSVWSAVYSPDGGKILSASDDQTIKEWDAGTGECLKTLAMHTIAVYSAVYSQDGEKILSDSDDGTIKEWDSATGQCLNTYKKDDPNIPGYLYEDANSKLKTYGNIIEVRDTSDKTIRKLINIPGLFIQGCSFKNLEKGSQWTPEGLAILKQYHANRISV